MSAGLMISDLLSIKPQESSPAGQMKMLPIEYIMPNPDNKIYIVGNLDGLKEDIRLHGVRQPLEVIRWANGYKLIGGERRLTACKQLKEEGDDRFSSLPCIIMESKGELDDKIALITANATARELTDGERLAQYEALKDALTLKKRDGQLEGKVRDEVCRILGLSAGAVARLNVISSCGNEVIKERLKSGEIGLMQAYKDAQGYVRYIEESAEEPEAPKEQDQKSPVTVSEKPALPTKIPTKSTATTSEDGVDWHRTATEIPDWAYQYAGQICSDVWIQELPAFTGENLLDYCKNVHSGHPLTGGGYVNYLPKGLVLRNSDRTKKVIFTWHWFVEACEACGISPEIVAQTNESLTVTKQKKPENEPRGHNTLLALASKTLDSKAAWELNLEEPAFGLSYYTQQLPGGATLWKQVDITREEAGECDGTRYAIILQDHSFFTTGWARAFEISSELVRYFELK